MNFSEALTEIKEGKHLTRTGWHTQGAVIYLVSHPYQPNFLPYIEMRTKGGGVMWTGTAFDLLAEDWEIVE